MFSEECVITTVKKERELDYMYKFTKVLEIR